MDGRDPGHGLPNLQLPQGLAPSTGFGQETVYVRPRLDGLDDFLETFELAVEPGQAHVEHPKHQQHQQHRGDTHPARGACSGCRWLKRGRREAMHEGAETRADQPRVADGLWKAHESQRRQQQGDPATRVLC